MQAGDILEGQLESGQCKSVDFPLTAGEVLCATLVWLNCPAEIKAFGPNGSFHDLNCAGTESVQDILLRATAPGTYRFELRAPHDGRSRAYALRLRDSAGAVASLHTSKTGQIVSPRFEALARCLDRDDLNSLEAFWTEVHKAGVPLIEDSPNKQQMLVTFLWRGSPHTKEVWILAAGEHLMERLENTDIWFKSLPVRRGTRLLYSIGVSTTNSRSLQSYRQPDPLNHLHFPENDQESAAESSSVLELPDAPPQPLAEPREGTPRGTVAKTCFSSTVLKNTRELWVYTPSEYDRTKQKLNLLVMLDGADYIRFVPLPTILDNLLASKQISPTVAVLVGSPSQGTRWREFRCGNEIVQAIADELIPRIRSEYHVSRDPGRTIIGGYSRGGLAAAWIAICRAQTFGNVISQSGAFWWAPDGEVLEPEHYNPYFEPNWLAREVARRPRVAVRFHLDAGTYEGPGCGGGDILSNTRRLRDTLVAKGYDVKFQEFAGAHDFLSWRGTIIDALTHFCSPTTPLKKN